MRWTLVLLGLLSIPLSSQAQPVEFTEVPDTGVHNLDGPVSVEWVSRLNGRSVDIDESHCIAVSPDGRAVYIAGVMATSEPLPPNYDPLWDAVTVAYDTSTGEIGWSHVTDFGRTDDPADAAISRDGKTLFIVGRSLRGYTLPVSDLFITAIDTRTGTPRWEALYDVDSLYLVVPYLVILSEGERQLFVLSRAANTSFNYLTVAVDAETGEAMWSDEWNGEADLNDQPYSIAHSRQLGMVFVTGSSRRALWPELIVDTAVIAYDAETGERAWVRRHSRMPSSSNTGRKVVLSPDGTTLYVMSLSSGDRPGHPILELLTYDARDGTLVRVSQYPGSSRFGGAWTMLISPDGRTLYVSGTENVNGGDFLLLAIDTKDQEVSWTATWDGGLQTRDGPEYIALASGGRMLLMVGVTRDSLGADANVNAAVVGFDTTRGEPRFHAIYDGSAQALDFPLRVAVARDGRRFFVTGYSEGRDGRRGRRDDFLTISYRLDPRESD